MMIWNLFSLVIQILVTTIYQKRIMNERENLWIDLDCIYYQPQKKKVNNNNVNHALVNKNFQHFHHFDTIGVSTLCSVCSVCSMFCYHNFLKNDFCRLYTNRHQTNSSPMGKFWKYNIISSSSLATCFALFEKYNCWRLIHCDIIGSSSKLCLSNVSLNHCSSANFLHDFFLSPGCTLPKMGYCKGLAGLR